MLNPPAMVKPRQQPDLLETPKVLNSFEASCDRCCAQRLKNWVWRQTMLLQVALESVSATHQLVSAIHTFAICVRPLLLTGFAANPDSAESGPVDSAEHKVHVLWTSVLGSWYLVSCTTSISTPSALCAL